MFFCSGCCVRQSGRHDKKSSKDIVNMLIAAMKDMGGYIVLVFVSAQFTSWFSQSNLATVFAVKGAGSFLRIRASRVSA